MYLPSPGADFELTPAGTHHAICIRVIDLGTQESAFNGRKQHRVRVVWELPDEIMKDGRPFSASKTYTWSMHKKAALRQHLEAWRGQPFAEKDFGPDGFNIKNILGKCCTLNVSHDEKNGETYAFVAAVGKAMKGHVQAPPLNPCLYLWLEPALFSTQIFETLGERLRDTIMRSPEFQSIVSGKPLEKPADDRSPPDDLNDDIPF